MAGTTLAAVAARPAMTKKDRSASNTADSLGRERCGLQDRRPPGDLRLDHLVERRRVPLLLGRNGSAQVGNALLHAGIIECLVERRGKLGDHVLRGAPR